MNLLSVNNLSKSYGNKVLFQRISFGISKGEKVALVAKNGSGKSTLFRIMKGSEIQDEGEVVFRKNISIAFLEQDPRLNEHLSIRDLVYSADNNFVKSIKRYEAALQSSEQHPGEKSLGL
jgi:ABC transport system ATP-binding/permease protein